MVLVEHLISIYRLMGVLFLFFVIEMNDVNNNSEVLYYHGQIHDDVLINYSLDEFDLIIEFFLNKN